MSWIKVHQSIATNRKVLQAADVLRIPEAQLIGHLVLLWLWSIENAPEGRLAVSEEMLRKVAGYPKPGRAFVDALVHTGLLQQEGEGGYLIVNYDEHIAPILVAGERNRRRVREFRERQAEFRMAANSR
jgi:hypothetical protein